MRAIRASRSPATRATARRRTSRLSPAVPLRRCTAARSVRCGAPGVLESPMSQAFVHLRLHTEYSLSDSVVRVPELVAAVAGMGMAAVAVTDEGNLFAMVKFYRAALKAGLKPIVGVDLQVAEAGEPRQPPTRVTLLCQSPAGYRNLTRLVSRAYLEGQERGTARIERGWLSPDALEGLIGLSCATEGDIGRALISARERDAERALDAWQALLADTGRVRRYSRQQYLRTPQEMAALFADLPEALANSAEIARRSSLQLTLGEVRLPQYPLPAGVSTEEFLREEAARGLAARFAASSGAPLPYRERLERELAVICQMGFAGYFLIVADFIRWAREHGVPVGPGRGSGAGSLVAYSLKITDLDPIRYDLLFERFLNPERVSLPDFDIDFCMDGRDRVIEYVAEKYGRERVSQIITYGTMAAKAVVRDVGRVLGMAYGYVDRIAKLIPFELAVALLNRARPPEALPLAMSALPMDDAPTYALLKSCRTTAVFQLESRGMKDLIRRLQPDGFEYIVALVALFRPGPLQSGMVDDFINRKHAPREAPIDYLHPSLAPVLKPTYGVILYQEQVMQIAQVLAGYTLGGADLLRRAMGKKSPEEMAQQRSVFVGGAVARGVREGLAAHIFDLMEKFAGYGFKKSHSAAYALLAYQTAYLKAHWPAEFMAAVLSADMDHTDKVVTLIKECSDMGLAVLPPDVNASSYEFTACGERSIRYGLGAVRGVGRGAVEALIVERGARGAFTSLEDLCRRLDLQKVNRRVLEALLRSGSLDGLGATRATLMERLGPAMHLGDQRSRAHQAGQNDLFGLASEEGSPAAPSPGSAVVLPEWGEAVRLAGERETLGLYLTGHPLGRFESSLARFVTHRIGDLVSDRPVAGLEGGRFGGGRPVTVAGLIDEVKKRGPRVILTLDDRTGRLEVLLFEETWQRHREVIAKDAPVLIEGLLRCDEFSDAWRLAARRITELDKVREQEARRLVIRCTHAQAPAVCEALAAILAPWRPGPCPITVEYAGATACGALTLGEEWTVRAGRELIEQLEGLLGRDAVQIVYGPPPASPGTTFSADGR